MTIISVHNVGKAYKYYSSKWLRLIEKLDPAAKERHQKKWVLKDISFSIEAGEAVGIVGVNGAGKSTLLKLLTGTTQPTCGEININGRVAALLELGMGFHPDFTGRQNVYMSGLMMGYNRNDINNLMPEIEKFADIGEYIDQPVRIYSSGMQMRLAFAVATASRPDILIVDEALSVGDSRFQAKCYERIAGYKKQGTTLLLVSHSAGDIVKHCDRAIFLKNGSIEMDGPSRDVTNRYFDELFGKSVAKNGVPETADSPETLFSLNTPTGDNLADLFSSRHGYRAEEYRWGQGGAKIIDYDIRAGGISYPSSIESNTQTDFYFKVAFEQDFDNVVLGILIKSLEGLFLYGSNSYLSSRGRVTTISVKAGDVRVYKFSFPMNLNQGDYLLSCGVSSGHPQGEVVPLDRRYDSIILHVGRNIEFWGVIDLESTFEIC
ncbi:ABC transporter ATP-binding protein [Sodalis sp. RH23]|uniref:ABC transporter ATP-binding protein n=1 Tax=unclassified Sodalis (in: enterobacteria) TaxID=2636512 RepID=UPI0039B479B0